MGFKDFVVNLDTLPGKVLEDIKVQTMLEDPVYLKSALENLLTFDFFFSLEKDDVFKIYQALTAPMIIFLRAIKNHQQEMHFINEKMPSLLAKQYFTIREDEKITKAQQEDARIKIITTLIQFMEDGIFHARKWKIPSYEILSGVNFKIDSNGRYVQLYENSTIALTGPLVKNIKEGLWTSFFPNGNVYAEGNYNQNMKNGEWSFFHPNGKIKLKGVYLNDHKDGPWIDYPL